MTIRLPLTDETSRPVAVVTGAAAGVGLATTAGLIDDGFAVVGVDLAGPPPALDGGDGATWVRGDVSDAALWDQVVDAARGLDPLGATCFASCAADVVVKPFLETPIADWTRLLEINVLGVVRGMNALMPAMLARGHGAIAVVCSVNSLFAEDALSAYSTSKAALLQVVRSAALEYGQHGLRINAVCPGAVDTTLFSRALESLDDPAGAREAVLRRTPTGEILRPEQVASVLRFLVGEAASGMSGAAVTVDGGLTSTYDFAVSSS
jgi:NAD(P)-dependent dehydrogenase (short-subunit alcohol dehydrogenase family)